MNGGADGDHADVFQTDNVAEGMECLVGYLMTPGSVFIRVSFFMAQCGVLTGLCFALQGSSPPLVSRPSGVVFMPATNQPNSFIL